MNFEEWDVQFDSKSLKKDVEDINSNNQERKEVPVGTYEVKITKLELTQSKKGDPMLACWFKVVASSIRLPRRLRTASCSWGSFLARIG